MEKLESIIRLIQDNKGVPSRAPIAAETRFREDLGFDSFDLAEFTVHVEDAFGVDVFEGGVVETVGEVKKKLKI